MIKNLKIQLNPRGGGIGRIDPPPSFPLPTPIAMTCPGRSKTARDHSYFNSCVTAMHC